MGRATTLLFVAKDLERIADRVTNIPEDIVFLHTGHGVELGSRPGDRWADVQVPGEGFLTRTAG